MTGGLVSIISYGCSDLYLTGAPQITFFKVVYRRYTNFSIESVKIDLDGELNFDDDIEIKIPKLGDCISKMYVEIELPEVSFTKIDAGMTEDEMITVEYDDEAEQNYNTILDFMQLNVQAYRTAINDYNAENAMAQNMLDNIQQVFTDAAVGDGESGGGGSSVDARTEAYRLLIDSFVNSEKISFTNSDLSTVILTMMDNEGDILEGISKDDVLLKVNQCIRNSINYQKFFFDTYKNYLADFANINSKTLKFAWVERLGHSIIDYIDIYIGGEKIDRHYGQFIDIWYELTGNRDMDGIYMKMIGNVSSLTTFDKKIKPAYKLVIPLHFWFTRRMGSAIPVVAMQYSDLSIKLRLKPLEACAYVEHIDGLDISLSDMWENKGYSLNCDLLVDYIYLEGLERKKFAQSAHEYLIEVVETTTIEDISKTEFRTKLDFKHPCKELIWVFQKDAYKNTMTSTSITRSNNYAVNVNSTVPIMEWCKMDFNGYTRIEKHIGTAPFFNYLQPLARHRNTPADGINVHSFSLNPEEHQPSCACNFSCIDNVTMTFQIKPSAFSYKMSDLYPHIVVNSDEDTIETTTLTFTIYDIKYNVLRIIGGFGALAFT
jgi:hypothetical protein